MPIYAYRCATCGHAQDVLQKISDALLTVCPSCGADTFVKQVTAAGFQLKGSGWYVTDFRSGNAGGAAATPVGESGKTDATTVAGGDNSGADTTQAKGAASGTSNKSVDTAAPAAASASPPVTTKGP